MRLSCLHCKEPRARLGMVVSLCALLSLLVLAACETGATAQPAATAMSTLSAKPTVAATAAPTTKHAPKLVFPPARGDGQFVYDAKTATLLLFGGDAYGSIGGLNDTWSWDGSTWTQLHPATAPTPRSAASLAYDAATGQVVLFGGISLLGNTPMLGDTWTWDGANWTRQHPVLSPEARDYGSMTYDAATGQIVLFGGGGTIPRSSNGPPPPLNDTWTWDGTTWTQQHPAISPSARIDASMAYDPATRNVVLFGGSTFPPAPLDDTWTWDGANWTQQHPATSPALSFPNAGNPISFSQSNMAYGSNGDRMMLILNGFTESTTGSDATRDHKFEATWTWDGRSWTLQDMAGPHEDGGVLVYDASLQSMIQFTMFLPQDTDTFEDKLWQWKGHAWEMQESWG